MGEIPRKRITMEKKSVRVFLSMVIILILAVSGWQILVGCSNETVSEAPPLTTIAPPGYSPVSLSDSVVMGPWLVSYGDPQAMLIRVALYKDCSHDDMPPGSVSVYDLEGNKVTGSPFTLTPFKKTEQMGLTGTFVRFGHYPPNWDSNLNDKVHLLEAQITGLSPATTYTYVIHHSVLSSPDTITAAFKTPPPAGSTNNVVFYAYGDNRTWHNKTYGESQFPKVEETMVDDMADRSFVLHVGDASNLGWWLNYFDAFTLGWEAEYLRSSNDKEWQKHVWLRANYPTFMSVGNHELKRKTGVTLFYPEDHAMYDFIMGNFSRYKPENTLFFTYRSKNQPEVGPLSSGLTYEGTFDSQTYMTDWGDLRIINLNTYFCFTDSDLANLKSKLQMWVTGRKAAGKPTILVLHSPIFWDGNVGQTGYKLDSQNTIRDEIIPIIQDDVNLVLSGHTHVTTRTKEIYYEKDKTITIGAGKGPVYYILGTGGAQDMTKPTVPPQYSDALTKTGEKSLSDYAWAKFTVDYSAGKIIGEIRSGNLEKNPRELMDHYEIPFK